MLKNNLEGISSLLLILLLLCSIVFGALLSYLWVMSNYYLEPESIVDLAITEVDFPADKAAYFSVTVMNPTHSSCGTNITEIYFTVEGNNTKHSVLDTLPQLPMPLERGTVKIINCSKNWGEFAGKTITVHVLASNASGATYSFKTEFVKLHAQAYSNASESTECFNLTVRNDLKSKINLTLTEIELDSSLVTNMSINLPRSVAVNESIDFQCFYDWRGLSKPTVTVKTAEGYVTYVTLPKASLNVDFDRSKSAQYFSATIQNNANFSINLTEIYVNDVSVNTSLTYPALPVNVNAGESMVIICPFEWQSLIGVEVTVTVKTESGFDVATTVLVT